MSQPRQELRKRIEELYVTSAGRLSHPMCQSLLETDYPALRDKLASLEPQAGEVDDPERARLEEARRNLEAQIERYEAINKRWNQEFSPHELRRHLA